MTGAPSAHWVLVVPVKGALGAKTRLGDGFDVERRGALAIAFARDTIGAALAVDDVERVIVVTDAPELADLAGLARVSLLAEGGSRGLNAAISAGVARARSERWESGVAVLLGDLPALRPADLASALAAAAAHPSAIVTDADGSGTTLLTAAAGRDLVPLFGPGSAAAHRAGGAVPLDLPAGSTLRHDVDTPAALAAAVAMGVGEATAAALAGIPSLPSAST
ncbi:MAG: 2-phospho-L-lactate guanylyltransferase [Leifsonia sp.]